MTDPQVTVVIPTHNRLDWLKEAVASVEAQTFAGWCLIVVDDASSDGTQDWLAQIKSPRIQTLRAPTNIERSRARNWGLSETRTPYVMFLDDDDRLDHRALARLIGPMNARLGVVGSIGGRIKFDDQDHRAVIYHPPVSCQKILWPEFLWGWAAVSGQVLYRTDRVRSVGGYPTQYDLVEDRYLWLQLAVKAPFFLVPYPVLEYRDHGQLKNRPPRLLGLRAEIYGNFIEGLPPSKRPWARRIRTSCFYHEKSQELSRQKFHEKALVAALKALLVAPTLLCSPLILYPYLLNLIKPLRGMLNVKSRRHPWTGSSRSVRGPA